MQDYKSQYMAAVIYAALVNTQTHSQTQAFDQSQTISSASQPS